MVTEDYVSFDIAKLLKEKGFKHWCYKCYGDAVYHKGTPISFDEECELKDGGLEDEIEYVEGYLYDFGCDNRKKDAKVYAAPTLQMAMKWLREVHDKSIEIRSEGLKATSIGWVVGIYNLKNQEEEYHHPYTFSTYEQACEAAIKYCLEKLI